MLTAPHACREGCAACCIAPSISTPIPQQRGNPFSPARPKPAGQPCPQLDEAWRCSLFGLSQRPACCSGLQPSAEMCGEQRETALAWLTALESATAPAVKN